MKKILALFLIFIFTGCSTARKKVTFKYVPEGKKSSEMACVDRSTSIASYDPIASKEGKAWLSRSLVAVSPEVEDWRKVWREQAGKPGTIPAALKEEICSHPNPVLSAVFNVDYPNPPEGTQFIDMANSRKLLTEMIQTALKYFYSSQSTPLKSSLACFEGKTVSGLPHYVNGARYQSTVNYKNAEDLNSIYVVRHADDEELHIAFGPISDGDSIVPDSVPLFDDHGPLVGHKRVLNWIRPWEIEILTNYYAFAIPGRASAESLRAQKTDWNQYLYEHTQVQAVNLLNTDSEHFHVVLYLGGFCEKAKPVAEFMPH